jgi:hypothetical protein
MMLAMPFVLLQTRLTSSTTRRILPKEDVELGDVPLPVEIQRRLSDPVFISSRFSDEALKWGPHRRRQMRTILFADPNQTRDMGSNGISASGSSS